MLDLDRLKADLTKVNGEIEQGTAQLNMLIGQRFALERVINELQSSSDKETTIVDEVFSSDTQAPN